MKLFPLKILSPHHPFYEQDCAYLEFPTTDGQYGIQANHSNLIAALVPGMVRIKDENGVDHIAAVSGGLIKVEKGSVLIMADTIERLEDIDISRNEAEAERAHEALLQKKSIQEYHIAEAQLARAMNRLKVKNKKI